MVADFLRPGADDNVGADVLSRDKLVDQACEMIANVHSKESSSVVGVVGGWGSGKTWVMESIAEQLEASSEGDWRIARFTPWAVDSPEGLIGEFYNSLGEALDLGNNKSFQKIAARGMRAVSLFAGLVPYAGETIASTSSALADYLGKPESWNSLFNDLSDVIREKELNVLVVADDIDRLQKAELYSLLKVIRLLGRFPGITFLLSLDLEAVGSALATDLSAEQRGAGALGLQYLEKYVQYRITIPPLTDFQKTKLIRQVLEFCGSDSQFDIDLSSYEIHKFVQHWLRLPVTIRTAQRFGHQLRATLARLHPAEVNLPDILELQLLQTIYPFVFSRIPMCKEVLTGSKTLSEKERNYFEEQLISGVPGIDSLSGRPLGDSFQLINPRSDLSEAEVVASILRELFPVLNRTAGNPMPGTERIADRSHFDRYFTLNIDGDDLSEVEAEKALCDAAGGKTDRLERLLACDEPNLRPVIENRLELSYGRLEPTFDAKQCFKILETVTGELHAREDILGAGNSWLIFFIADLIVLSRSKLERASILDLLHHGENHKDVGPNIARRVLNELPSDMSAGVGEGLVEYGKIIVSCLIEDMAKGDEAPIDVHWRLKSFIFLCQLSEKVKGREVDFSPKAKFKEAFGAGKFGADDFASRFVHRDSLTIVPGGKSEYAVEATLIKYFRDFDDPFFDAPIERHVYVDDDSWRERKLFCKGRCGEKKTG